MISVFALKRSLRRESPRCVLRARRNESVFRGKKDQENVPTQGIITWHPGGANRSNLPHVAMTPLFY